MTPTRPRTPGTPRRQGSDLAFRTTLRTTFAAVVTLLLSSTAQAQMFRSYLASDGNDGNACTLAAPCRLLPAALAAVADGGEVWMLDSANYNTGPVNLTRSVTILAVPGALGSLVAAGGNAVNIATAGVKVALRNLVIVPLPGGGGTGGIVMTAGDGLTVENCLIANVPGMGIAVHTAAAVRVANTTIRDNGANGLRLQDGAHATVTRATFSGNTYDGIVIEGTLAGTTTNADISGSTLDGKYLRRLRPFGERVRGGQGFRPRQPDRSKFSGCRPGRAGPISAPPSRCRPPGTSSRTTAPA